MLFVDDRDDDISLGGGWEQNRRGNVDFMYTSSRDDFEGVCSTAYRVLEFNLSAGKGISVYGSIAANNRIIEAEFSIDGGNAEQWSGGPKGTLRSFP